MADFIIAVADLAEAEGRALRRAVVGMWQRLALIVVMLLLTACGAGLLLWALYQSLAGLGPAGAALLTGVVALLAAGGLSWLVRRITP